MTVTVADIAAHLKCSCPSQVGVRHLVLDSRKTEPDTGFVALPGEHSDGRLFFAQALAHQPPVIIYEAEGIDQCYTPEALSALQAAYPGTAFLRVSGVRDALSSLANLLYPLAGSGLKLAAVTGTNGKTTVASWVTGACQSVAPPVGFSGTLGIGAVGALAPSANTTPDIFTLSRWLFELVEQGAQFAMLEASSHALAQGRMIGLPIDTAVWTQLSQDHLDYHGTLELYAEEKCKLLRWPGLKTCVLNLGDATARAAFIARAYGGSALTYCVSDGNTPQAVPDLVTERHFQVTHIAYGFDGMRLSMQTPSGCWVWTLPFWGRHNAENALAALLTLISFGWSEQLAADAIAAQPLPAGRLERFFNPGMPAVIVDYAHTPDALAHLLRTVRQHARGRVWVVFGCGGNRDRGKRPEMGKLAAQLADQVILTNDNPRNESPEAIVADIASGVVLAGGECVREYDRAQAVSLAIEQASAQDVVVVAGKGHETYQEIAGQRLAFSDRALVRRLLGLENNEKIQTQEFST